MLRLSSRPLIVLWLLSRMVLSSASESAIHDGQALAAGISGAGKSTAAGKAKLGEATVDYLRDIRPILSDSCYACHGPDQASRQANLRLDQWEATLDRESPAPQIIVPWRF